MFFGVFRRCREKPVAKNGFRVSQIETRLNLTLQEAKYVSTLLNKLQFLDSLIMVFLTNTCDCECECY